MLFFFRVSASFFQFIESDLFESFIRDDDDYEDVYHINLDTLHTYLQDYDVHPTGELVSSSL